MAKRESTQHVLDRVRKPRVHITYDVETGGAIEMKELPFVVGVMADLSGKPVVDENGKRLRLKDRKFKRIDRDNFQEIMAGETPSLAFAVPNRLTKEEGAQLRVGLQFRNLGDFEPENVVNQVEPMRKLLEARQRLSDLKTKLDGNDRLDELLTNVLKNPVQLGQLRDAVGVATADTGDEPASAAETGETEGSNE